MDAVIAELGLAVILLVVWFQMIRTIFFARGDWELKMMQAVFLIMVTGVISHAMRFNFILVFVFLACLFGYLVYLTRKAMKAEN
jgi:Ca2+/Na+ antiporter